ncbi:maleylpyruvate isomerase family mycothiol-dependent enzyme [Nocardioides nanhaiensis]|uniref:Mycothiol-dependent maleylpyruvate isomerase metal-binding domain-containing protein n=1 Tax=Nocardioides nanhaiensis TaxID=1476871 RepID=A0ABP8WY65_9ACTN
MAAREWRAGHERVCALVEQVAAERPDDLELPVPATPDWSARQLLAHMVGLGVDVLDGDEPDDHNESWTRAQVAARATSSAADLVAEWRAVADQLETYLREQSPRPLGDLLIHEQDLRSGLGVPGARATDGLAAVRATMADRVGVAVRGAGLAPLVLEQADGPWRWTSGPGEPGLVLGASGFDLFRAVTSRRTAAQLHDYRVDGDLEPYLPHLALLGPLPTDALPE